MSTPIEPEENALPMGAGGFADTPMAIPAPAAFVPTGGIIPGLAAALGLARLPSLRWLSLGLIGLSLSLQAVAFYQPWVEVELSRPKFIERVARVFKDKRDTAAAESAAPAKSRLLTLSGAGIPRLANKEYTKRITELFDLLGAKTKQVGLQSYAVYAVPLLLALLVLALVALRFHPKAALVIGLLSWVIFAVGAYQVHTLDADPALAVRFCYGLWLALGCYLSFGAAAFLESLPRRYQRKLVVACLRLQRRG
jgi:hypothetical protein